MTELNNEINVAEDGDDAMKIAELNVHAVTIGISLQNLRISIKNIEDNLRLYQKETLKFIRSLKKNQKNKSGKKSDPEKKEREPSGFYKKTKIRKELIDFFRKSDVLNIIDVISSEEDEDSKFEPMDDENTINRPSATKIINRYIKEKGLQQQVDRRFFVPDESLKKILAPLEKADKNTGGYRYFNMQKYIKHLFI